MVLVLDSLQVQDSLQEQGILQVLDTLKELHNILLVLVLEQVKANYLLLEQD